MSDRGRPPQLEGFTFVELIGQGGFADVFLYEQRMPSRRVAVKVLLASAVDGPSREQFTTEANVMAQLSGHPSIVPIYQAGTSLDGRPYLVMEYCPPPSLAGRFRAQRFGVPEAVETMIKISAAVETAHRAGILHRDIKPHNILTSTFGSPMLTDFGIAGTTHGENSEVTGLSVPWSPPEAFGDIAPVDPRSDVWSLAATLYSLLAGRSPFEVVGAANDNATLMSRIERQGLARISRADMPEALHALLDRAMNKEIAHRHPTAMAFARALQDIQTQLSISPTRIDVLDATSDSVSVNDAENRTHVRPVQIIVPDAEPGTRLRPIVVPQIAEAPATELAEHTVLRSHVAAAEPIPDTMAKSVSAPADRGDGSHFLETPHSTLREVSEEPRRSAWATNVACVLAAAVIVVIAVAFLTPNNDDKGNQQVKVSPPTIAPDLKEVVGASLLPPTLSHRSDAEGVTFSWKVPKSSDGEAFAVRSGSDLGSLSAVKHVDDFSYLVKAKAGDVACIEVSTIVGPNQSDPARACEVNR